MNDPHPLQHLFPTVSWCTADFITVRLIAVLTIILLTVQISVRDNVMAQHCLVTKKFGITSLVAVLGWSMGAGQTFQWAVR